jgi:hypothetical protein
MKLIQLRSGFPEQGDTAKMPFRVTLVPVMTFAAA